MKKIFLILALSLIGYFGFGQGVLNPYIKKTDIINATKGIKVGTIVSGTNIILIDSINQIYTDGIRFYKGAIQLFPYISHTKITDWATSTSAFVTGTPWTAMGYVTGTPWTSVGYSTLTGTQTLTNKTLTSPKVNEDVVMTRTSTQLNRVDATSSIQGQLNANAAAISDTTVFETEEFDPTVYVKTADLVAPAIGTTANLPLITGTAGVIQAGAFGTGATNFTAGNDSRLSDARVSNIAAGASGNVMTSNGSVWTSAAAAGGGDVTLGGTQTLTNKRWTARVGNTTTSATPTINTDNYDIYKLTAQAGDISSFTTNLTGTPVDGDILEIQITGTAARAITWGTSFVASTVALPTTTVTTATLSVIFQYYTTSSYGNTKWICVNTF